MGGAADIGTFSSLTVHTQDRPLAFRPGGDYSQSCPYARGHTNAGEIIHVSAAPDLVLIMSTIFEVNVISCALQVSKRMVRSTLIGIHYGKPPPNNIYTAS